MYAWKATMGYQPNTTPIPRRLSLLDSNGNEWDYVDLRSSSMYREYSADFLVDPNVGQHYGGTLEGRLVSTNLNGSAVWYPFRTGLQFNVPTQ